MKNKTGKDLTRGKISKKIIKLSLPIMLSNFMLTFYNITDTFWLGKIPGEAKNAVATAGLAFPLVFFLISFGFGFVVAGVALISRYKGADDFKKVKKMISQSFLIMGSFALIFLFLSNIFLKDILKLLNTPDTIFNLAHDYLQVIFIAMVFMFVFFTYQSISYGLGDTVSPMKIQAIAVILNIILDPIFIFGYLGVPELQTVGAAYATLIARATGAVLAVFFMFKNLKEYLPKLRDLKPDFKMLKEILKISIPASISRSMTSFGFLFLQGFVNSFGTVVISIYSIGSKLIGFFMMPARGIGSALSTFVGQNLGAKNLVRVKKGLVISLIMVMSIMTAGALAMYLFGGSLTKFFIDNDQVIEAGKVMFKITSFAAWIFGVIFVFTGFFNGAGKTTSVLAFNVSRLWIFRIPLVYILSGKILNFEIFKESFIQPFFKFMSSFLTNNPYESLWWAMLISNILSAIWAFFLYRRGNWKKIRI